MNRLLEIGFEPAGRWLLKESKLTFELSRHASRKNVLYAFISSSKVLYIGQTRKSLSTRLGGYKKPAPTQRTNLRLHPRIKTLLLSGATVEILALPDPGFLHYGQFHLNIAAGLEASLIAAIAPSWNGGSTTSPSAGSPADNLGHPVAEACPVVGSNLAPDAVPEQPTESESPIPIASFRLVLHRTYYEQGFFNVGVRDADRFGSDGQKIEIFCGESERPIVGWINRTANTNNTPRIMGGEGLKDWFKRNMRTMQEATVIVLSPTAIRVEPCEATGRSDGP